jgi:NTE family protein
MQAINQIFGGGGSLVYEIAAASVAIADRGLPFFGLGGASAGAIVAACLAAGYPPSMLKKLMFSLDLASCLDYNFSGLIQGGELGNGLVIGDKLHKVFKELLPGTLGDIKRPFFLVANNCTTKQIEYFTPQSHPDLPLATAVRASMSIPVLFKPIKIGQNFYCDGGTLNNNPFDYWSTLPAIGVKVENSYLGDKPPHSDLWSMAVYAVESLMGGLDAAHEQDAPNAKIIRLESSKSGYKFDYKKEELQELWDQGYAQAERQLDTFFGE